MQNPYSISGIPPQVYGEAGYLSMEAGDRQEGVESASTGIVFPEVYYKVQPFVMASCDAMCMSGGRNMMPTGNQMETMSEEIYMDVSAMYPDLLEYAGMGVTASSVEASRFGGYDYGGRFRRRGLFRDIIDILLLNELFRRGRFFY